MKKRLASFFGNLDLIGLWLGLLSLRILLGWDYFESGLATRFFSVSLIVLTVVAIASVHWPESWSTFGELMKGYVFTDKGHGNFKLPVIFIGMLIPLVLSGPGRFSIDHLIRVRTTEK